VQRRFIISEGIFRYDGTLCPVPQLVALKNKHKFRVLLDESLSWGVLGSEGRGVTEHFGLAVDDVDVIVGSMATVLGGIGGFVVGSQEAVDHQRLSGAGYCYSASLPPFLCAVAAKAVETIQTTPSLPRKAQKMSAHMHEALADVPGLAVVSAPPSPIVVLRVASDAQTGASLRRSAQERVLQAIVNAAEEQGVLLTRVRYLPEEASNEVAVPGIRVSVRLNFTEQNIRDLVAALTSAASSVMENPDHLAATAASPPPHTDGARRRRRR
jgi:serine palmitoyltransferase